MAGVLVRLKLRLLKATLANAGISGTLAVAFALVLALTVGALGFAGFAALRLLAFHDRLTATSGGLLLVVTGWVLFPVLASASEETLPVDRLALFPLTRRQLLPGLLLASAVGFGGLVTLLTLAGLLVAWSTSLAASAVTLAATAATFWLCIGISRLMTAVLTRAMRRRRWRDVAVFAVPLVALTFNVVLQLGSRGIGGLAGSGLDDGPRPATSPGTARTFLTIVEHLPTALPARAMAAAAEGRFLVALGTLAAVTILLLGVVWAWGRALDSLLTSVPEQSIRPRGWQRLHRGVLRPLPRTRSGAVAVKELRMLWRDPRRKAAAAGAVLGGVAPLIGVGVRVSTSPRAVLLAALPAGLLAAQATNLFGYDGGSYWLNVVSADDADDDLAGKQLAVALVAALLFLAALVVLVTLVRDLEFVLGALAVAAAAVGTALGVGAVVSVAAPVPIPESPTNVFSSGAPGRGLAAILPSLGCLLLAGAAGGLVTLVCLTVAESPVMQAGLVAASAAAAVAAARVGRLLANRRVAGRLPELLLQLDEAIL